MAHERRQEHLIREGITKPKTQGIINIGKAEAPSYGIEDQFSKSQYLKTNIKGNIQQIIAVRIFVFSCISFIGLVETCKPGDYTPRKRPTNNPSANPSIRSKWTTGVVISTKY